MSYQIPASAYPKTVFTQTTPDESQELGCGPKYRTWQKSTLTGAEIYERQLPDKSSGALRIDGPSDNGGFISLKSDGKIVLRCGEKNVEKGAGSGKLCIFTNGQQQKHNAKSYIEYNKGTGEDDSEALNVIAYGDVVEDAVGSERHIKAKKIIITAEEELMLIGGSQVLIQAGSAGGGAISMVAGNVEKITNNDKQIIIGQRMTFGVGEDSTLSFDPRASVNIVSPGHIGHNILGDYQVLVGGCEQHIVAGNPFKVPLIKARDSSYAVKTLIGGQTYDAADFISNKAGGAISSVAGGAIDNTAGGSNTVTGGGATTITAGAALTMAAGAALTQTATGAITQIAGAAFSVTAVGDVTIKGALIKLN